MRVKGKGTSWEAGKWCPFFRWCVSPPSSTSKTTLHRPTARVEAEKSRCYAREDEKGISCREDKRYYVLFVTFIAARHCFDGMVFLVRWSGGLEREPAIVMQEIDREIWRYCQLGDN
jgi:hypothetical protein